MVIHANHPRELDEDVLLALRRLKKHGVSLLNQSVLLRGVNDSLEVMKELCERLVDGGVVPYYLHQLDRARGTAHFEVSPDEGRALIKALAACLPGFAVPKYVQEVAGEANKILL